MFRIILGSCVFKDSFSICFGLNGIGQHKLISDQYYTNKIVGVNNMINGDSHDSDIFLDIIRYVVVKLCDLLTVMSLLSCGWV